jgi:hypothetical protein
MTFEKANTTGLFTVFDKTGTNGPLPFVVDDDPIASQHDNVG